MGAEMSKWLEAANRETGAGADLSEPRPKSVVSVLSVLSEGERASPAPTRADGLDPDGGAYLDRLRLHGPQSYGAMASALGWGATRAWQAEAKLRAAGLVVYQDGKAVPTGLGHTPQIDSK